MASPSRSTAASRRTEDPPPTDQAAVVLVRTWHRLKKLEAALTYLIERVAALEGTPGVAEAARKTAAAPRRAR